MTNLSPVAQKWTLTALTVASLAGPLSACSPKQAAVIRSNHPPVAETRTVPPAGSDSAAVPTESPTDESAAEEPTEAQAPSRPIAQGRVSMATLITKLRAMEIENRTRALHWIESGHSEGACHYLSATTAGTWLIEQALRSKAARAAELFGTSGQFTTPVRHVGEFCAEAFPAESISSAEYTQAPSLTQEIAALNLISPAERQALAQVDGTVVPPGTTGYPITYLRWLRSIFPDFCQADSRFQYDVGHLRAAIQQSDRAYAALEPNLNTGISAMIYFRGSELVVAAHKIISSVRAHSSFYYSSDSWAGGAIGLLAGATAGGLSAIAIGPFGILVGLGVWVGSGFAIGEPMDYNSSVLPHRRSVTDVMFKVKGVADLLASASFDSVSVVSMTNRTGPAPIRQIDVSTSGPLVTENAALGNSVRRGYMTFANRMLGATPEDSQGRFNSDTYYITAGPIQDRLEEARNTVCDIYPLEFDSQGFCRDIHRQRCQARLNHHYSNVHPAVSN